MSGPPSLARGAATVFSLRASVWSPFWPSITVAPSVDPVGAVSFNSAAYVVNSAAAVPLTLTSQRSDRINVTVSFKISAAGYLLPPENLVLATAGGELAQKRRSSGHEKWAAQRVDGGGREGAGSASGFPRSLVCLTAFLRCLSFFFLFVPRLSPFSRALRAAAIWTLVSAAKCKAGGTLVGTAARDSPVANHAVGFWDPHSVIYSKRAKLFYIFSSSAVSDAPQPLQRAGDGGRGRGAGTGVRGWRRTDRRATWPRFRVARCSIVAGLRECANVRVCVCARVDRCRTGETSASSTRRRS